MPVLAPEGTAARPKVPSARITSTSTVGLPRLSRISRPRTFEIGASSWLMTLSSLVLGQLFGGALGLEFADVVAGGIEHHLELAADGDELPALARPRKRVIGRQHVQTARQPVAPGCFANAAERRLKALLVRR